MKISRFAVLVLFVLLLNGCASLNTQVADPADAEAAQLNMQLGMRYMQNGRFAIAEEKLQKALQYDNNLAEAENALGVLFEITQEADQAREHFRRAITMKPDYVLAQMNYGRVLCANGNPDVGQQHFLKAAQNPKLETPEQAYTGAGVCARRAGNNEQALSYYQLALEANPDAPGTLFEIASVNQELGRSQQALPYLERYHESAQFSPASLKLAMDIAAALGQSQQHTEYKNLLLSRFANSAEAQSIVQ